MTQPDTPPSRRQFRELARRVTSMDKYGSKYVLKMAAQLAKIAHDVADLKRDFEQQQQRREERRRERIITRRWVIGTGIAAIVALVAVITLLLTILHHVK